MCAVQTGEALNQPRHEQLMFMLQRKSNVEATIEASLARLLDGAAAVGRRRTADARLLLSLTALLSSAGFP